MTLVVLLGSTSAPCYTCVVVVYLKCLVSAMFNIMHLTSDTCMSGLGDYKEGHAVKSYAAFAHEHCINSVATLVLLLGSTGTPCYTCVVTVSVRSFSD